VALFTIEAAWLNSNRNQRLPKLKLFTENRPKEKRDKYLKMLIINTENE
jgi:hypothetical protein